MLMHTDPFRELDRLTQQVFGTNGTLARPSVMPMDAWRDGDTFHVEFDLPGIDPDSIDLDVERNVVTVKAERPPRASDAELIAAERPRGIFSRQLILGDNLDTEHIAPATTPACSPCRSRSPSRPSPARSPSPARVRTGRPSTPEPAGNGHAHHTRGTGGSLARTVDEQFLDLICNDEDLLAAEFDAIIAAEWPRPPANTPGRGAADGRPASGAHRRTVARIAGPGGRPRHPGIGGWARQLSPCRRQPRPTTGKAGDRHTTPRAGRKPTGKSGPVHIQHPSDRSRR